MSFRLSAHVDWALATLKRNSREHNYLINSLNHIICFVHSLLHISWITWCRPSHVQANCIRHTAHCASLPSRRLLTCEWHASRTLLICAHSFRIPHKCAEPDDCLRTGWLERGSFVRLGWSAWTIRVCGPSGHNATDIWLAYDLWTFAEKFYRVQLSFRPLPLTFSNYICMLKRHIQPER